MNGSHELRVRVGPGPGDHLEAFLLRPRPVCYHCYTTWILTTATIISRPFAPSWVLLTSIASRKLIGLCQRRLQQSSPHRRLPGSCTVARWTRTTRHMGLGGVGETGTRACLSRNRTILRGQVLVMATQAGQRPRERERETCLPFGLLKCFCLLSLG